MSTKSAAYRLICISQCSALSLARFRRVLQRYVRLMSSQIRLSVVCLFVTLVHPIHSVELVGCIFAREQLRDSDSLC